MQAEARITSSLFVAGQEAGLSDNLIMQLAAIFGWDIDFALDIRAGDSFKLLFEQRFKDGRKVDEGPILAAEFSNRGDSLRAVRYTAPDGITGYYSETGMAMRKAFLRTPLKFTRISSNFNLRRRHPVLNRIRAHRGVDYAAPTGTPVKAAGDGVVVFAGTKGGYGKTVVLRHGGVYSTLYAHLSRYAGGLRRGQRVGQGAVIGYVGSTGLATGPHLHYEFQVNGIHRDPLNVPLPRAEGIPADQLPRFEAEAALLLAQLDGADSDQDGGGVLAMSEDSGTAKLR
jgi:murein DD-endopeptidase MepM/ murein hydrolase activator NlpD